MSGNALYCTPGDVYVIVCSKNLDRSLYWAYILDIKNTLEFKNRKEVWQVNLAKISTNGQITIPIEIRRKLKLKTGDKILFLERDNGDIVLSNASLSALLRAQEAFQNVAETTDLKSEYQVQAEINKIRYNKD